LLHPVTAASAPVAAAAAAPVCEKGVAECREMKSKCSEYFLCAVIKHTIRLKLGVYFDKQ